ncbi:uncharacterized protein LOC144039994 [Vanacampus margaritifer]
MDETGNMNLVMNGNIENAEQECHSLRAQQHKHCDTVEDVCHTSQPNCFVFDESSAQADGGAAPREHQERQGHRENMEHANTLELKQKLKEKEKEVNCLLTALTDAEMLTAFISKLWMDAYEQLKMTWEDNSNNMVAAINAEWQKWWAYREQETAEQFQTQWENMQWHMNDMTAQLESMQRHNLEMSAYFRSEMESLKQHMGQVIHEKDDMIAKLQQENCILATERGETSHSFKNETTKKQQSLNASEAQLRVEQKATIALFNVVEDTGSDPNHDTQ